MMMGGRKQTNKQTKIVQSKSVPHSNPICGTRKTKTRSIKFCIVLPYPCLQNLGHSSHMIPFKQKKVKRIQTSDLENLMLTNEKFREDISEWSPK
jgi:hypothetical protein